MVTIEPSGKYLFLTTPKLRCLQNMLIRTSSWVQIPQRLTSSLCPQRPVILTSCAGLPVAAPRYVCPAAWAQWTSGARGRPPQCEDCAGHEDLGQGSPRLSKGQSHHRFPQYQQSAPQAACPGLQPCLLLIESCVSLCYNNVLILGCFSETINVSLAAGFSVLALSVSVQFLQRKPAPTFLSCKAQVVWPNSAVSCVHIHKGPTNVVIASTVHCGQHKPSAPTCTPLIHCYD